MSGKRSIDSYMEHNHYGCNEEAGREQFTEDITGSSKGMA
jgi:hypothetical protein